MPAKGLVALLAVLLALGLGGCGDGDQKAASDARPATLAALQGWGWSDGMRPAKDAPLWPMEAMRARLLGAFTPGAGKAAGEAAGEAAAAAGAEATAPAAAP